MQNDYIWDETAVCVPVLLPLKQLTSDVKEYTNCIMKCDIKLKTCLLYFNVHHFQFLCFYNCLIFFIMLNLLHSLQDVSSATNQAWLNIMFHVWNIETTLFQKGQTVIF